MDIPPQKLYYPKGGLLILGTRVVGTERTGLSAFLICGLVQYIKGSKVQTFYFYILLNRINKILFGSIKQLQNTILFMPELFGREKFYKLQTNQSFMSKGSLTKEKIAQAAAQLINTQGYHGMSLKELMSATELEKGGIYNHFENKEAIALSAFDTAFVKILERFKAGFSENGNARQKLSSIVQIFASYSTEPVLDGPFPLIGMAVYPDAVSQAYGNKVLNAQQKMTYFIQVIIAEGVETGLFRPDLNIIASVKYITAALYGGLFCSSIMQDKEYMGVICTGLSAWIQDNIA